MITPCRKICQLDPAGRVCVGCGRTLQEIADWRDMTDEQRRVIMHRVSGYKPGNPPRRLPQQDDD